MDAMNIVPNALPALPWQRRVLGRGALLPLVMLVTTVYWGIRPWTVLVIAAAGAVAVFAPPVAGGLAAIALIGFASCAFALFLRDSTNPPGSGTLRQYPLHSVVFGPGFPHAVQPDGRAGHAGLRGVAGAAHHRRPLRAGPAEP